MDRQQEFVLRTIEERDIRFVRLWFTDVLGTLKSVAVAPAELEGAFAEGIGFDGSAIEGFARVYESDMLAKPDPATFQVLPWRGESPGHGADVLRHPAARRHADVADPRHVLKRALAKAADLGFTFYTHPEIEFFLLEQRLDAGPAARCRSTRPATSTTCRTASATTSAAPRSPCSRRWASRWSSATTRAPRARTRSTCATPTRSSTADNIMTFRHGHQGGRARAGRLRVVHAQAVRRAPRARACTPTCRCSRATATPSTRPARRYQLSQDRPAVHRRAAARTRRDHRGHQPVGQLLQAALGRRRGAGLRLLGPQQPLGAGPRADVQAEQGHSDPGRGPQRSTRACNPYLAFAVLLGGRAQGHRGGLRAARRSRGRRLVPHRRRAPGAGHRAAAASLARRSPSWRAASSSPRPSASTSSTSSCATSAPSGTTTAAR